MQDKRRKPSAQFKAKVAIEAIGGKETITELFSFYGVHTNQISEWEKQAIKFFPDVFSMKCKLEKRNRFKIYFYNSKFYIKIYNKLP